MDYGRIYLISDKDLRDALNLFPINDLDYYKVFKGELHIDGTLPFQKNYGKKVYDLVNSRFAGLYLFSKRTVDLLLLNNVSGWKTYPTIIRNPALDDYSLFSVTSKCGEIDYSRSSKFMKQPYSPSGKAIEALKGLYFNQDSWDNSNIFSPINTTFTFVTEKVKKIFEENKISNIKFEKITQVEIF